MRRVDYQSTNADIVDDSSPIMILYLIGQFYDSNNIQPIREYPCSTLDSVPIEAMIQSANETNSLKDAPMNHTTEHTITPHVALGKLLPDVNQANDIALWFNLATLGNLEARPELDGYQKGAFYRIRVCHVRTLNEEKNRNVYDTIGWIR